MVRADGNVRVKRSLGHHSGPDMSGKRASMAEQKQILVRRLLMNLEMLQLPHGCHMQHINAAAPR